MPQCIQKMATFPGARVKAKIAEPVRKRPREKKAA